MAERAEWLNRGGRLGEGRLAEKKDLVCVHTLVAH